LLKISRALTVNWNRDGVGGVLSGDRLVEIDFVHVQHEDRF
jgi:hypothetical protein